MTTEYIWGCELNAKNKEYVWQLNDEIDGDFNVHLLLKRAVLGTNVPDKEENVVALESFGISDAISQPLFRLTAGECNQCLLDMLLTHPGSKLTLVEGSGPVYLWGQQVFECADDASENEENGEVEQQVDDDVDEDNDDDDDLDGDDDDDDFHDRLDVVQDDGKNAKDKLLQEELNFLNKKNDKIEAALTKNESKKRPAPSSNERSRKKVSRS